LAIWYFQLTSDVAEQQNQTLEVAIGTTRYYHSNMPTTRSNQRKKIKQVDLQKVRLNAKMTPIRPTAKLFSPLYIADGGIELSHRVIMAPMTRNRGVPLKQGTAEEPNRTWLADELVAEYYAQRASKGGLIITEGIPPSIEVI
jgi:NADH:flavin oxidoreductase / NADH oxidase family